MLLFLSLTCVTDGATASQPQKRIHVSITGVKGNVLKNIQSRLNAKESVIYTQQPDIIKWRYYLEIRKEVKAALAPFGYFKAKIKTHLDRSQKIWHITVQITPGPRLRFTRVSVVVTGPGKNDKPFQNYLANLPIETGKYFNSANYEKTKDRLQDIANARGYFNAEFTEAKLIVDLKNDTSEAIITFNTGQRFRFGETAFSTTPFKSSLLFRYLTYKSGQYYNNAKLEKSRNNLSSSNYFQQVIMIPKINAAKNRVVPIKTDLAMQDQVVYSFGAGYGTVTGIRGLASMDLRWLNSRGHSLKLLTRAAQFNSTFSASYLIPGGNPAQEFFTIEGSYNELNQVTGRGRNFTTGFNYQNSLWNWRVSAGLNYLNEKYQLNNFPIQNTNTDTNAQMFYPRVTLQKTYVKKNPLNPDYGYSIALTAAAGSQSFGSKTSFSQFRLDTKFLYTLPTDTRVVPRASLGYTTIKDLTHLPLSMQFYAGGFPTVRGFLFNQIGPGRALAIGSFELQQKIYKKFYLAGFIDAGLVTDTNTTNSGQPSVPLFKHRWNVGAGPAVVYLSPIGAVEISVAKVLNAANNATNPFMGRIGHWVIQFGLGVLL
ncbi:MAG: hypothetical protein A3F10_04805 [Coxiella sp. RIFCSPHIGHO2_12_FULL_42_15]|nr:MAG: hypothetical protein A3F10_04805 [Coxiella sp. RIFCSPHIGHO2_12_FULL_42_15]